MNHHISKFQIYSARTAGDGTVVAQSRDSPLGQRWSRHSLGDNSIATKRCAITSRTATCLSIFPTRHLVDHLSRLKTASFYVYVYKITTANLPRVISFSSGEASANQHLNLPTPPLLRERIFLSLTPLPRFHLRTFSSSSQPWIQLDLSFLPTSTAYTAIIDSSFSARRV